MILPTIGEGNEVSYLSVLNVGDMLNSLVPCRIVLLEVYDNETALVEVTSDTAFVNRIAAMVSNGRWIEIREDLKSKGKFQFRGNDAIPENDAPADAGGKPDD